MNPTTIIAAIDAAIGLAGEVIPLIGGKNSTAIGGVISKVEAIAPAAISLGENGYTAIKSLIENLGSHPATTDSQLSTLQALDAKVDADWASMQSSFDPDYKPPTAA